MSDFGDVPTAILSAIDGAVTLGGNRDGFIAYSKIPADQFPYAMVFNPTKEHVRGEHQHGLETTANPVLVVFHNETIANVNDQAILIEAALNRSTLGGKVEDTWVALVGRDEGLDSEFTALVFSIETRVYV